MIRALAVEGFKSLRSQQVELGALTVLIGANGAGKSNLLDLLRFIDALAEGRLREHVGLAGGPEALLFDGLSLGSRMSFSASVPITDRNRLGPDRPTAEQAPPIVLEAEKNPGADMVAYAAGFEPQNDGLRLAYEKVSYPSKLGGGGEESIIRHYDGSRQLRESTLLADGSEGEAAGELERKLVDGLDEARRSELADILVDLRRGLRGIRVFQFHDTSVDSPLRTGRVARREPPALGGSGANLGATLLDLKTGRPEYYERIVETARLLIPSLDDFVLQQVEGSECLVECPAGEGPCVPLRWRAQGTSRVMSPRQLSDGSLRAIALVTALLLPDDASPRTIVVDEPELGLHPYAVTLISGLLRSASEVGQVIASTQSPSMLDRFHAEEVLVAEREAGETKLRRLDLERLDRWLGRYSLAELWEKNVIGGRPE